MDKKYVVLYKVHVGAEPICVLKDAHELRVTSFISTLAKLNKKLGELTGDYFTYKAKIHAFDDVVEINANLFKKQIDYIPIVIILIIALGGTIIYFDIKKRRLNKK